MQLMVCSFKAVLTRPLFSMSGIIAVILEVLSAAKCGIPTKSHYNHFSTLLPAGGGEGFGHERGGLGLGHSHGGGEGHAANTGK